MILSKDDVFLFAQEVDQLLDEDVVGRLNLVGGVQLPLREKLSGRVLEDLQSISYVVLCLSIFKKEIPIAIHNRMILCGAQPFLSIYVKLLDKEQAHQIQISDFNLIQSILFSQIKSIPEISGGYLWELAS